MLGAGFCEGLDPALQGLLSVHESTGETGRLFALVYMCGLIGDITGGPLMSTLMSIGRSANSVSDGYCFLVSSVCSLSAMQDHHNECLSSDTLRDYRRIGIRCPRVVK